MAKLVIVVLITLSVFTGCTTGSVELEMPQPSIVIDDTVVDTTVLLAEQAYISGNQLFIQFRHQSDTIDSLAILPEPDETLASGSSTTLYLQHAIDQFNDLPLAQLSYIESEQWIEQASRPRSRAQGSWSNFSSRKNCFFISTNTACCNR